jgi:hypothetical protein
MHLNHAPVIFGRARFRGRALVLLEQIVCVLELDASRLMVAECFFGEDAFRFRPCLGERDDGIAADSEKLPLTAVHQNESLGTRLLYADAEASEGRVAIHLSVRVLVLEAAAH